MVVPILPDDRGFKAGTGEPVSMGRRLLRSVVFAVVCIGLLVLVAVLAQNIGTSGQ